MVAGAAMKLIYHVYDDPCGSLLSDLLYIFDSSLILLALFAIWPCRMYITQFNIPVSYM